MLFHKGTKTVKGESVKVDKIVVPFIESDLYELSLSKEVETMAWLRKWHH